MVQLTRPDGSPIENLKDWTPPKKKNHLGDGGSAKALAESWFRTGAAAAPDEFIALMKSEPRLRGLRLISGIPELVTGLPRSGGGRNHDLWLLGETAKDKITICIEGKTGEPFGNYTVGGHLAVAIAKRKRGKATGVPERIDALLGLVEQPIEVWADIRYQLLTAICGTAMQARLDGSSLAVFVVHEFHTWRATARKVHRNEADYRHFLKVLGAQDIEDTRGRLHGPFAVAGIDCLVGKAVTEEVP